MARKPRIHLPNGFYHATLHGGVDAPLVRHSRDYKVLTELVLDGLDNYQHKVHGYCWLPQQFSFIIQVSETSLAKIIQNIAFRYTRYINTEYDRSGSLFKSRYQAVVFDADEYLLPLLSYVHYAALRHQESKKLKQHPHSSYRPYAGESKCDWLTLDYAHNLLAKRADKASKKFRDLSKATPYLSENNVFQHGHPNHPGILGSEAFIDYVHEHHQQRRPTTDLKSLIEQVCKDYAVTSRAVKAAGRSRHYSEIRSMIGYLWTQQGGNLTELARWCNRDATTLLRNIQYFSKRLDTDTALADKCRTFED